MLSNPEQARGAPRLIAIALSLVVLGACGAGDAADARDARDTTPSGAAPGGAAPSGVAPADTAEAPPDTASYRIESPQRGVVWHEGETHVIRWTRTHPGPVDVGAAVGGKDRGHLAFALPAGTDSVVWRIPVGFVTGFGPERSDAVRIRVESSDDPRIGAESAPFTIAAAGAATSATPP